MVNVIVSISEKEKELLKKKGYDEEKLREHLEATVKVMARFIEELSDTKEGMKKLMEEEKMRCHDRVIFSVIICKDMRYIG